MVSQQLRGEAVSQHMRRDALVQLGHFASPARRRTEGASEQHTRLPPTLPHNTDTPHRSTSPARFAPGTPQRLNPVRGMSSGQGGARSWPRNAGPPPPPPRCAPPNAASRQSPGCRMSTEAEFDSV
jgi:hypothetical protein